MSLRTIGRGVGVALILAAFGQPTLAQHDPAWPSGGDMPVEWDQPEDVYEIHDDPHVELAQATTRSSSNRSSTARTASRAGRTSRVPYMIGDSTSSPSNVVTFTGIPVSTIEHPTFGGNRFNVAENNSVIPDDRVFASYRHFNNVNQTNVLDRASVLDVERWDLGFEKSALDGLVSAQFVVPLLRQLNSDLTVYDDGFDSNLPVADRHGELGNLAFVGKLLLVNRSRISVSAGVAVNAPTADDARIFQYFDDPSLVVSAAPLVTTNPPTSISMAGRFDNETVNPTPFFAWSAQPTDRFFHQGFLQIDAPLNRSDARVAVGGIISPDSPYDAEVFSVDESGEIDQQTLLRLNLSFGYWLMQGNPGGLVDGLAGVFEVHYTTALEDANPFTVPITTLSDPSMVLPAVPFGVSAGPTSDNFDQVNLAAGLAANIGMLQITNGVIVPVTVGVNRSFDFEYCLQASRRF